MTFFFAFFASLREVLLILLAPGCCDREDRLSGREREDFSFWGTA
jgi:hypothetical protein